MAGPHCERLDGMASQIDLSPPVDRHRILRRSRESVCLSVSASMAWPHKSATTL